MSLSNLINRWRHDPSIIESIEAWETIPARKANLVPFPENLHPAIVYGLQTEDIHSLYSHQNDTFHAISNHQNVVIVTGTSSGKSLCYNLPVASTLINYDDASALYLFPTKALAHDQLSKFNSWLAGINQYTGLDKLSNYSISTASYDGDTPITARSQVRTKARIIFSNPDMLHAGILPQHTRWESFFKGLRFVIIDEMHTYRGVFGSHVANVIRRLKRIAGHYGTEIQFILTSATIGNPLEHAQNLIEESVVVIDEDGSARGENHFLIYNPPIIDPDLGIRASVINESIRLADDLYTSEIQTIVFSRTRRSVEILLSLFRSSILQQYQSSPTYQDSIRAYRSGYLPAHRRIIEAGLRSGSVRTVIATSALELGIDIGHMGAALLVGFPGSISGTWQQAGRAGRGQNSSVIVLMSSSSPVDQFLAKHPQYLFSQSPEQARINPDNLLILLSHLKCAIFELPFKRGDCFGNLESEFVFEFLDLLIKDGSILKSEGNYYWLSDAYPSGSISLRNTSAKRFPLQTQEENQIERIGEIDESSAFWMVHPGAIYLHEGDTYIVDDLDYENQVVTLQSISVDYYTRPTQKTEITLIEQIQEKNTHGCIVSFGNINVKEQVTGFNKHLWMTNERIDFVELTLPPSELVTQGYFVKINEKTVNTLREQGLWNNDPNDYGPDWKPQRKSARERDNFTCQVCGIIETDHQHHVHHKIPFRSFNSYGEANNLGNLVTLCSNCHKRVETGVRIRTGLSGLTHLIGYLAPFYLMCDQIDIGVYSDPQSHLNAMGPILCAFDRIPGGMGFSQRLYDIHNELFINAYELTSKCGCNDGCPSCVGPGGEFGGGSKKESLAILEILTNYSGTTDN